MKWSALSLQVVALTVWLGGVGLALHAPVLKTFGSSASGGTYVTIDTHGVLRQFVSPTPSLEMGYGHTVEEHIEGYVLCYTHPQSGATVIAHDLFFDISEGQGIGFAPPAAGCSSATACTVTRKTTDQVLQLRQDFAFSGTDRRLRITMAVKNLTGTPVSNVALRRAVWFHVDGVFSTSTLGWAETNHYARTADSVFAWTDGPPPNRLPHGMLLKHVTKSSGVGSHGARVTADIRDASCDPANIAFNGPVLDAATAGATILYPLGSLSAGQSKSVTVDYERF